MQKDSIITPRAVFADNYTMQSVHWRDYNAQTLPDRADGMGFPRDSAGNSVNAESTCPFVSMVINNSPNSTWNAGSFGSAGQEGTFRMMESWSGKHYWWSGSQVVMNMGRYHHSGHNYVNKIRTSARAYAPAHMGVRAFQAGSNHYVFNTNLFSSDGRPPLSPSGVNQVTSFGE